MRRASCGGQRRCCARRAVSSPSPSTTAPSRTPWPLLTPTPTLAPTLTLAPILTLSLPLIEVHAELAQEEQKRAQWRLENSRRRHNYVPFIIRYLKTLADRGELTTHVEAAKKKRKHPA